MPFFEPALTAECIRGVDIVRLKNVAGFTSAFKAEPKSALSGQACLLLAAAFLKLQSWEP